MRLEEIKESILDYYVSKSVDYALEFDVLMILDKGLVVKNWREKRSFIALETSLTGFPAAWASWITVCINCFAIPRPPKSGWEFTMPTAQWVSLG